jgi:hypothetical protein
MAGKENPFSRAIASKKTADAEPVAPVSVADGVQTSLKNDELQQPIAESDNGHASDTPNAVNDNTTPGSEESFGLSSEVGIGRKGENIATPDDGSNAGVSKPPTSPGDQFGLDVTEGATAGGGSGGGGSAAVGSAGGSGGTMVRTRDFIDGSPKDQVEAASGDHGPSVDLTSPDLLAAVTGAQSGGERLTDAQIALGAAAIAGASATETEPSVAADAVATGAVFGAAAGSLGGAALVAGGGLTGLATAGAVAAAGVGGLLFTTGAVAGAAAALADEQTEGASSAAIINSIPGARPVADAANFVGEVVVAASDVAAGAITPGQAVNQVVNSEPRYVSEAEEAKKKAEAEEAKRKAEEEEAKRKAEEEAKRKAEEEEAKKKADAGTSTDPDDERLTPAQRAAVEAIKAELQPQGNVPGDIDPGDGDGTNTGTASAVNLSAADQILIGGTIGLVGNPGAPGGSPAPSGGGGTPTPGPDGTIILLEDGANVDGARTEDLPNFNVGSEPLIGFPSQDDDEETESGKQDLVGSLLAFDQPDKDADDE